MKSLIFLGLLVATIVGLSFVDADAAVYRSRHASCSGVSRTVVRGAKRSCSGSASAYRSAKRARSCSGS